MKPTNQLTSKQHFIIALTTICAYSFLLLLMLIFCALSFSQFTPQDFAISSTSLLPFFASVIGYALYKGNNPKNKDKDNERPPK